MAEIDFLPVCSNCRNILDEYKIHAKPCVINKGAVYIHTFAVEPGVCPFCNIKFDDIKVPCKLPFGPIKKKSK